MQPNNTPLRPQISKEGKEKAAQCIAGEVCKWGNNTHINQNELADHIKAVFRRHMDGYEIAKELDSRFGYDPNPEMVESLDLMQHEVDEVHQEELKKWVEVNNITPPFEIGTEITEGFITGICTHYAACYLVRKHEVPEDHPNNPRLIVKFEDAVFKQVAA